MIVDAYMKLAIAAATQSTCIRRQVGATLITPKGTMLHAANGAPSQVIECTLVGTCHKNYIGAMSGTCHDLCKAIHAEQRVIIKAMQTGVDVNGATLYVTHKPCILCAKLCVEVGISTIYYKYDYPDALTEELLKLSQIKLQKI